MNGIRNSPAQMFRVGGVVPLLLITIVIANIVTGEAWWPDRARGIEVYTDSWRLGGTILLKLGFAGSLIAWYLLANFRPTAPWTNPTILLSLLSIAAGLIAFCTGFILT